MRITINSREPTAAMRPLMKPFKPSMIAATEMTEVTPITMPNTVSADRALRERNVSSATPKFSKMRRSLSKLFRPQCDHRIEPRRPHGRINSKENADERAQRHPQHRDPDLHRCRKRREGPQRQ